MLNCIHDLVNNSSVVSFVFLTDQLVKMFIGLASVESSQREEKNQIKLEVTKRLGTQSQKR